MDIYFKSGNRKYALEVFKEMAFDRGILPSVDDLFYSSFLHGLRILSREDNISKMLNDMEEEGIHVDLRTFNIFVDAYCKEGAENLVKIMYNRRIDPNVVTYRWVIEGYCLLGKMSKAREVFDSMRYRGGVVVPDIFIYNSLLNGYFKDSKIEEAMHLFHKMMGNGVKHGTIAYDNMGVFRFVRLRARVELFAKVPTPNECTFKIVMEGLCNNNRLEQAVSLFRSIGDEKLNSNIDLYNILIDGASKSGKLLIARSLYNDTTSKGLQPNGVTYVAMINAFIEEGMVEESREMFLVMKEKGFLPNIETLKVLRGGFLKIQQLDIVRMLSLMIPKIDELVLKEGVDSL